MVFGSFQKYLDEIQEVGFVEAINGPWVLVTGLPNVKTTEVVVFENGSVGEVYEIVEASIRVLLLKQRNLAVTEKVVRTNMTFHIPISTELLGKAIDSFGDPLYNDEPLFKFTEFFDLKPAKKSVFDRKKITAALVTGVALVDLLVPLGKGQRQLVIGDKKTGKTAFCMQTLKNQASLNVICIYCAISKTKNEIRKVFEFIKANNIAQSVILVASSSDDSQGKIFMTPYTAMRIAEYFRDLGNEVLVVLDDLENHSKIYREITLLAKRFPGRSSYPGDIFYIHAALLERAGNFDRGSISCLPVVSTIEGDITGYLQTNLMSMTDGHLYFNRDLFYSGQRPAIDYFLSVTRVGRQTQDTLRWSILRELSSFFSLYKKTQNFVHFGAEINEGIKATLSTGQRLMTFFNQSPAVSYPLTMQLFLFGVVWGGLLNSYDSNQIKHNLEAVLKLYGSDKTFTALVDKLVTKATNLNSLLGNIMKDKDKVEAYFHL